MTSYAGTKVYNYVFNRALAQAHSSQIDFLAVAPASVKSAMNPGGFPCTVEAIDHANNVCG